MSPLKSSTISQPKHNPMARVFWILAIVGAIAAILYLFFTLANAEEAVQEAAGAAISACFAIIPYVLARAVAELETKSPVR
jgi:uncharacterized integral membrane protein